ncbi:RluA family pseudouridine synthase [Rickettsia endosymbiont of Cardiosporidium cionae]|uniref:RluA family pseudouridine synthase n=1 Tax=Rickettsia endosymbiont of Cardiosporidium cionae TaxID=2777155 RepID=UPI001894BE7F|nr:RluA family pseudouridine synthase [Rickettsia endosymbiont of Cardiosporidium cionae]KAF8818955.1 RluA family pseudouridine synthase [Rickettsia endosymbiont of Cardiosporidium cionae]
MLKYLEFRVSNLYHKMRLDKALSLMYTHISRTKIQQLIKNNNVTLNAHLANDSSTLINTDDLISLKLDLQEVVDITAKDIEIDILYEDGDLIIVNKPTGLTVHPGAAHYNDTLVNALMQHSDELSNIGGIVRPGIVHRLDRNTSGLMVVAKNNKSHVNLSHQIQNRSFARKYYALIWGKINSQGCINFPIARSKHNRKKMAVRHIKGRNATTHYKLLKYFYNDLFSLVECRLETGRTHQIRVHMEYIKHSIVGDSVYRGSATTYLPKLSSSISDLLNLYTEQLLHAFYIEFQHPSSGKIMEFFQDIPKKFADLLKFLESFDI